MCVRLRCGRAGHTGHPDPAGRGVLTCEWWTPAPELLDVRDATYFPPLPEQTGRAAPPPDDALDPPETASASVLNSPCRVDDGMAGMKLPMRGWQTCGQSVALLTGPWTATVGGEPPPSQQSRLQAEREGRVWIPTPPTGAGLPVNRAVVGPRSSPA